MSTPAKKPERYVDEHGLWIRADKVKEYSFLHYYIEWKADYSYARVTLWEYWQRVNGIVPARPSH